MPPRRCRRRSMPPMISPHFAAMRRRFSVACQQRRRSRSIRDCATPLRFYLPSRRRVCVSMLPRAATPMSPMMHAAAAMPRCRDFSRQPDFAPSRRRRYLPPPTACVMPPIRLPIAVSAAVPMFCRRRCRHKTFHAMPPQYADLPRRDAAHAVPFVADVCRYRDCLQQAAAPFHDAASRAVCRCRCRKARYCPFRRRCRRAAAV